VAERDFKLVGQISRRRESVNILVVEDERSAKERQKYELKENKVMGKRGRKCKVRGNG
jgi:hypothetical protein